MTVAALATAVMALRLGRIPAQFFVVPIGGVVVFPTLVAAALIFRKNLDAHKRLMLIATTELLTAGVGRWPVIWRSSTFVNYAVTDILVLLPLMSYDLLTRRRVHAATAWGGLFLIATQAVRTAIGQTDTWIAIANWVKS